MNKEVPTERELFFKVFPYTQSLKHNLILNREQKSCIFFSEEISLCILRRKKNDFSGDF